MKERYNLEDVRVDGRITLNLKTWDGKVWPGFESEYRPVLGSCEDGNEH
jgi:hypothetical protein